MSTTQDILARRSGRDMTRIEKIKTIVGDLITTMGWDKDVNFENTPERFAKWLDVYEGLSKTDVIESIQRHFKLF